MRIPVFTLLLILPVITCAQDYQNMNQQDMQNMMQQMQKMESCMRNVDQSELEKLENRSREFEAETKSLCASGKRDLAQSKAIAFAREISANSSVKEMQKCSRSMTDMMRGMMPKMDYADKYTEDSGRHVCD